MKLYNRPSNEVLAYIAGMMDGEGTITIAGNGKKNNVHGMVKICNNNKACLEWIRDQVNCGNLYQIKREHGLQYWLEFYKKHGAREVVSDILPYLHIKKPNAELILLYWEQTDRWSCAPGRKETIIDLKNKLNFLNRRKVFNETRLLSDYYVGA